LFDKFRECASIAELVNQVKVGGCLEHLLELDDVGVTDFGENCHLHIGELRELGLRLEHLHPHHLHRKQACLLLVLSPVNVAVLPRPNFLLEHVVLDNFVHVPK